MNDYDENEEDIQSWSSDGFISQSFRVCLLTDDTTNDDVFYKKEITKKFDISFKNPKTTKARLK